MLVVQAISADTISLSTLGSLIADAKYFTSCFNELHYSHTKREGNQVAHSQAQHARYVTNYIVWMEFVPPPSFSAFQVDLAFIL